MAAITFRILIKASGQMEDLEKNSVPPTHTSALVCEDISHILLVWPTNN
jgi:hypothetical protein